MNSTRSFEKLLTPGDVATLFGVKAKTISHWARDDRLPCVYTLGGHRRFRENDVHKLLEIYFDDEN